MDNERIPNAQSRARRVYDTRRLNFEESPDHSYAIISFATGDADTTAEAGAAWGSELFVNGYERVMLHLDFTHGGDISVVHVAAQASPVGGDLDEHWYDVYSDEAVDGVLIRKVYDLTTGADARVAWIDQRRTSRFMRFKVWTTGTNRAASRVTLRAMRVMDAA